jgi:hypothetical protein
MNVTSNAANDAYFAPSQFATTALAFTVSTDIHNFQLWRRLPLTEKKKKKKTPHHRYHQWLQRQQRPLPLLTLFLQTRPPPTHRVAGFAICSRKGLSTNLAQALAPTLAQAHSQTASSHI